MKATSVRALVLTVVEIEEMIASLRDSMTVLNLNGQQRQQLEEAISALRRARSSEFLGEIHVPIETLQVVLRCVSVTQQWLQLILAEFGVAQRDDN
jgi:putative exporter of polyketide antibiotics